MSTARALPLALAATALLTGCGRSADTGTTYQGYVEGEFVYLSSSQAGTLTQLSVERGQAVAAGTPVFSLEAVSETAALRQAQHQLAAARAQLADLQTGKRPPEIAVTRAQLAQATAQAARAAAQRVRDERQYAAGGLSQQQLDDTRTAAQTTAAQMRELQNQVEVARLPGREQQVAAQAAQVDAAQAAVTEAQWKLDQKRVAAPAAGRVYDTLYRVGEWVQAGNPVVQMLPPQNLKVRFFVPEAAIVSLAPGKTVSVHCDGCPADLPARITYVSSEAEYTPPVIYSNASRTKLVFMVEARPALADAPKLHPGQPVAVRVR
ncbi:HlyD family efflux transporter periplasmic adaptor subunit [Burkholderia sp. IDO3]|uniref:HlyD family secretion protein n=1 Tax=Burkholderia sp. IDO3 TaxID=1705310 RepID=UPI000BBA4EE3|nr:HlyD family efflux transporter periplasmic adaptor subunit [Burkholderia sp. IDO3]AXK62372.1 HlyD family efflux transporter periplasmic adaptor subunit [Burkholderia sp. IDO3]PCD63677.1 secretion protein HlyD [Burkholderia sp. IDO3]